MNAEDKQLPALSRTTVVVLLCASALGGAAVMAIEILGARVISPMFGVSLFVWTALISVALLGLAAGYAIGGRMADRWPTPVGPCLLMALSGLWVLAIPWLQFVVLPVAAKSGVRSGAFAGAVCLFGPIFLCLGALSPYFVRLLAAEWRQLGRTVGWLSALSTGGSFVGALGTGYWAIAAIGVAATIKLVGLALVGSACMLALSIRAYRILPLAVPAAMMAVFSYAPRAEATLPDGTRAEAVFFRESFYGGVRVVDYRYGQRGTRELLIDGLLQGGVDLGDGRSIYEYPYLLEYLPRTLVPNGSRCLVIGLGAGIVPSWYARQGVETIAVDIDPAVVDAARDFFGLDPRVKVVIEDARRYFIDSSELVDYAVLDVFNGDSTPGYLLSHEALNLMKSRLRPGGVLAVNFFGSLDGEGGSAALVRTLGAVFANVAVFPVFDSAKTRFGNIVVVAGDIPLVMPKVLAMPDIHPEAAAGVADAIRQVRSIPLGKAVMMSDDFNPIDVSDMPMKESVRRAILDSTPPALLMGTVDRKLPKKGRPDA